MRVAVVLLTVLLAGCTTTPESRQDNLFINVTTEGPWTLDLPVPADPDSQDEWKRLLRVSVGEASITWQHGELPLHVEGNGTVRLEAIYHDRTICCLLEFNQGPWTAGDVDDGLYFQSTGNISTMRIEHTAIGCRGAGCEVGGGALNQCVLESRFQVNNLEPGRHEAPFHVSRTCYQ